MISAMLKNLEYFDGSSLMIRNYISSGGAYLGKVD